MSFSARQVVGGVRWIAYQKSNAYTGHGAVNTEGATAAEWDTMAQCRTKVTAEEAQELCNKDVNCHGFTYDFERMIFWKLKDVDPAHFQKNKQALAVYVKEDAVKANAAKRRAQYVRRQMSERFEKYTGAEKWVQHENMNAFTGAGATNTEGACAEEWDYFARSRPPATLAEAKVQCDEDPECHGFTYDPDNQLYWKVKDLDPRKFRRAHNHELHVYVKEMAHVYYTQMIQAEQKKATLHVQAAKAVPFQPKMQVAVPRMQAAVDFVETGEIASNSAGLGPNSQPPPAGLSEDAFMAKLSEAAFASGASSSGKSGAKGEWWQEWLSYKGAGKGKDWWEGKGDGKAWWDGKGDGKAWWGPDGNAKGDGKGEGLYTREMAWWDDKGAGKGDPKGKGKNSSSTEGKSSSFDSTGSISSKPTVKARVAGPRKRPTPEMTPSTITLHGPGFKFGREDEILDACQELAFIEGFLWPDYATVVQDNLCYIEWPDAETAKLFFQASQGKLEMNEKFYVVKHRASTDLTAPSAEALAAAAAEKAKEIMAEGTRVKIHKLTGAKELNGTFAFVHSFIEATGRYIVCLEDHAKTQKSLKPDNLMSLAPALAAAKAVPVKANLSTTALPVGTRVLVLNLSGKDLYEIGATDLNGSVASIHGYDKEIDRYSVELVEQEGQVYKKLKLENLSPLDGDAGLSELELRKKRALKPGVSDALKGVNGDMWANFLNIYGDEPETKRRR